jgi:predicted nucleic acid-binding protein
VIPADDYVSSAVVLAELRFGVAAARTPVARNQRQARLIRIERTGIQWLPFTQATSSYHAELMSVTHPHAPAKARSRDMMIAATAYELGAQLATLNVDDFRYVASLVSIVAPVPKTGR